MIRKCPACKDLIVSLGLLRDTPPFVCRRCKATIRVAPRGFMISAMIGIVAGLAAMFAVMIKVDSFSRHLSWIAVPWPVLFVFLFAPVEVVPDPSGEQNDSK
jgi:hypothetical protein